MAHLYPLGDLITVTGTFKTSAGVAFTPTNIFFEYKKPNGTTLILQYGVDAALVNDGVGIYHVNLSADLPGIYYYRMYSTGTGQTAKYGQFTVGDFTK